jgi:hypothetical protein
MPKQDTTPPPEITLHNKEGALRPVYRVGDEIIFKFEGNLRAQVEGYEIVDGRPWLVARALLGFKVPFSKVVGVEREE